jgi:C1A family cysteine protease
MTPTLEETRAAIDRQKLGWQATDNAVGRAFGSGRMPGMGFAPRRHEPSGGRGRIPEQKFAYTAARLPARIDWRSVDSGDYTTAVKDQGQCGSCVAFAVCAVLEARAKIASKDVHRLIDLSESHLFFCGTKDGCENGWNPGTALKRCREHGIGAEKDFPYQGKQVQCKDIDPILRVPRWRVHADHDGRREAIVRRGPVIAGMHIYGDFGWYRGGVYRPTTSASVGLHAVAIIGYDDELGCWIVKNSWGTGWGEGGYALVGYGTCGIDAEFPFYDPVIEDIAPGTRGKAPAAVRSVREKAKRK